MTDNQCATPHIGFFNAKVFIVPIAVAVDRKSFVPVELCNVLLQFKPQSYRVANCFQKYGVSILIFRDACVSVYIEVPKLPSKMRIILCNLIALRKSRVVTCIYNGT